MDETLGAGGKSWWGPLVLYKEFDGFGFDIIGGFNLEEV